MSEVFSLTPKQSLLKIMLPISMGFMMLMCIDFADVLIARLLSVEAQAVLGYCYGFVYFLLAIGFGLNQGLTIVASEAYVKYGDQALLKYFLHGCLLALSIALILMSGLLALVYYQLFDHRILGYLYLLKPYLTAMLFIIMPTFLLLLICGVCQIRGETFLIRNTICFMLLLTLFSHPVMVLPSGFVFHLFGLSFQLPYGLDYGLTGIAVSKCLVTICGLLFMGTHFLKVGCPRLHFEPIIIKSLLQHAFPASLIQLLVPVYLMMLTKVMTTYGVVVLAGFSLGFRVVMVFVVPILGVLIALMVMISHEMVKKNYERVKEMLLYVASRGSLLILSTLALMYGIFRLVIGEVDAIEQVALMYLKLAMYITVLEFLISVCIVTFQSVKQPKFAFLIQCLRTIVYPMPIFYVVVSQQKDLVTLWWALALSFSLAAASAIVIAYRFFWLRYMVKTV